MRKTFNTGSNYTCPSHKPTALIPFARRIRGGEPGRSHKNETRANSYKGMINVELRLILEYLTIFPSSTLIHTPP